MPSYPNEREWNGFAELGTVGTMATVDFYRRVYSAETISQVKYAQRRVRQFVREGLLEKTDVTYNAPNGSIRKVPSVLRLTPKGGKEVEEHTGYLPPRLATSDPPTIPTLMHRVGVSRVLLQFRDACRHAGLPPVRWLLEYDRYPNAKQTARHHEQFILHEYFGRAADGTRIACRADASVRLELPSGHVLIGYVEYDRASDKGSQLLDKCRAYAYLLDPAKGHYRSHWPDGQFARVLFVTTATDRINNVRTLLRGKPGAKAFRFALEKDLDGDFLARRIWHSVDDDAPPAAIVTT